MQSVFKVSPRCVMSKCDEKSEILCLPKFASGRRYVGGGLVGVGGRAMRSSVSTGTDGLEARG
jgi:hypothetical protein